MWACSDEALLTYFHSIAGFDFLFDMIDLPSNALAAEEEDMLIEVHDSHHNLGAESSSDL